MAILPVALLAPALLAAALLATAGCRQDHATVSSDGQKGHMAQAGAHRPETDTASPIALDPGRGQEIGSVFEAFLSPQQEGGEESDTPAAVPEVFKSTAPSVPRDARPSRGHGVLSFTKDLSKAYVHVAIQNVAAQDIVMFHIHCGKPGQLGPILINVALAGDLQQYWADHVLTLELTNKDIEAVNADGSGVVGALTNGCPITPVLPTDKVKTIAGMEAIAREGELYFNLHTAGQTFFGDIRGQLRQVK